MTPWDVLVRTGRKRRRLVRVWARDEREAKRLAISRFAHGEAEYISVPMFSEGESDAKQRVAVENR